MEFAAGTLENICFWEFSRGDFRMLAAIKTSGAITLYGFDVAINYENYQGGITRDNSNQSFLLPTTVLTAFETSSELLVIGCPTCENGGGELRVYNPQTLKLLKGVPGVRGY